MITEGLPVIRSTAMDRGFGQTNVVMKSVDRVPKLTIELRAVKVRGGCRIVFEVEVPDDHGKNSTRRYNADATKVTKACEHTSSERPRATDARQHKAQKPFSP